MTPKAEFFDTVADARGARTVLESAKLLKIDKPKSFYQILRRDGILAMGNLPYQKFVNQGYFRVNLTEKNGFTFSTTYVTNKGLAWLQEKYGSRA
jgi:phage antirepressor YoqD-like protein